MNKQNKIILGVAVVVILFIAVLAVIDNKPVNNISVVNNASSSKEDVFQGEMTLEKLSSISSCPLTADKDAFAKCLTEKGFTMYGAEWCSHCKAEKAMFGSSFKYINYVECPDNLQLCIDKGIAGYPTWIRSNE